MYEFENLLGVIDRLQGPEGCVWTRQQTFFNLQTFLLEEVHELIEAIDINNSNKILEELGDVFYTLLFLAKLAENKKIFTLHQVFQSVAQKQVRRHPHVFDNQNTSSPDEILNNWELIKKREGKKSPIADIPPTLPALARAQKVIHKLNRCKPDLIKEKIECELGQRLWSLVQEAESQGLDAESVLRRTCLEYEQKFRDIPVSLESDPSKLN